MKTSTKILTILLLTFSQLITAQNISSSFTKKMKLKAKETGYLNNILGENEKYIFADLKSTTLKGKILIQKIKVLDKNTMEVVSTINLYDAKNKSRVKQLDGKEQYSVKFAQNKILVFYKEEGKFETKIYAESYNQNSDLEDKMTLLMTIKNEEKDGKKKPRSINPGIILNNNLFCLFYGKDDENEIDFIYESFDFELNELHDGAQSIQPPGEFNKGDIFELQNVKIDKSNNLYIICKFSQKIGKERVGLFLKIDSYSEKVYISAIDIQENVMEMLDINQDNINLKNLTIEQVNDKVNVIGFFCDNEKDPSGNRIHGFCFSQINSGDFSLSEPKFSYFSEEFLNELFKDDQADKLVTRAKGKKNKAEAKEKDKEAVAYNYIIEKIMTDSEGNMTIFCTKMNNYSVTTCTSTGNGGQSCTTRYYCEKRNVTVFKIDDNGEFVWASNLNRQYTYSGTGIKDVNVIEDEENFYVTYAHLIPKDEALTKKERKVAGLNDTFLYSSFNKKTGEYAVQKLAINTVETEKEDKKLYSPSTVRVLNNQFYVISSKTKVNPLMYLTCLCPPVLLIASIKKWGQRQEAFVGRFQLDN